MSVDLLPSENVLWNGAPIRFPVFDGADVFMVPFSIVWCGVVVRGFAATTRSGPTLFGLLFVLVGVYMLVGRLVVRWLTLHGTQYVVTDQRVVVLASVLGIKRERSEYLARLEPPTLRESADGIGTIRFGSNFEYLANRSRAGQKPRIQLLKIENARYVRDIIAEARVRRAGSEY